jgi:RNA polymerase sigma-70 factor (ECF subfamily)
MNTGLSDNEIISKVLGGDQQAFAGLVKRYQNYVFTITLRYIPSREDAEEVAQDVFVKAFRFLSDFHGETAKFSTWLYTIVTSTCLSFLRKKKVNLQSLDDERVFASADTLDSGLRANTIEGKSKQKVLNEAINLLSTDDAQIITLFYKAEQTLEEIGQILHTDPNTLKVRLHRARQRLREKMEKHFPEEVKSMQAD